ncbi:MAG: D-alanyl-D-alanine carboxypeptidase [Lawsonibacter sp.]|nr:D-alanyl-D-alanine carboxypeptidase [Lawsonibacter sp.]
MKRTLSILCAALILILPAVPSHAAQEGVTLPLTCASAVLMERETGTVLYQQDPHTRREPASVTKIMTLLLVMEAVDAGRLSMEDMVTVSSYAAGMGGSQVYLEEGEQMPVSEMIKCVTVVSGNDCAVALAEHLAGSEAAFVAQMNQRAQELGMADTTFLNCTGLPAQGHMTSAYDIALMSRELLCHPQIRDYTTIWMDTIRDGSFGLTNTNRLVRFYQGATGLKTGYTSSAQYCMSASAERDGMELIAVVMKSPSSPQRFEDARALLDYGFAGWSMMTVYPEVPLAPVDVLLGEQAQLQPQQERECRLLLRRGEEDSVTTRLTLPAGVEAPVDPGQTLGQLEVYVGEELRDTVPILASQPVARLSVPGIFSRMLRHLLMAG